MTDLLRESRAECDRLRSTIQGLRGDVDALQQENEKLKALMTKQYQDDERAHRVLDAAQQFLQQHITEEGTLLGALADLSNVFQGDEPPTDWEDVKAEIDAYEALEDLKRVCIPCQACGADPRVSPPSGRELPIIQGALDAQAETEKALIEAERTIENLRYVFIELDSWFASVQSGEDMTQIHTDDVEIAYKKIRHTLEYINTPRAT